MKINIVYATILGTSQMVAEDLEDALSEDHEVDVQDADRDIAITGFQLRQIAFGHAGYITQHTS